MYDEQGGLCAICSVKKLRFGDGKKSEGTHAQVLLVDHDHATNTVRALLCCNCNFVLGHAKDNQDVLLSAIAYLDRHCTLGDRPQGKPAGG